MQLVIIMDEIIVGISDILKDYLFKITDVFSKEHEKTTIVESINRSEQTSRILKRIFQFQDKYF